MMRPGNGHESPFEQIRRTNAAGGEFWASREFAQVLGYTDYRSFEQVIQKAPRLFQQWSEGRGSLR
jgi:DNA-damage-inducible protein D